MKKTNLFCRIAPVVCTLALFAGQVSAQLPCYGPGYQPKFPSDAELLKKSR